MKIKRFNRFIIKESKTEEYYKEISYYLRDIYSELDEEFNIKTYIDNYARNWNSYVNVDISKKSKFTYKNEVDDAIDWAKYKPSTFELNEVIDTIKSSKSYIESMDGELLKIWIHIEKNIDKATSAELTDFNDLLNFKEKLIQISLKFTID